MTDEQDEAVVAGRDSRDRISAAFDKASRDFLKADMTRTAWDDGYAQAIVDIDDYMQLLHRQMEQMRSHLHRLAYRYAEERNNA